MSMIELVIEPKAVPLVGGMSVMRILPVRARRQVGPFTFLDEMTPMAVSPGEAGDVPPHPHIGLSTLTYLFQGEIDHRDSLGTFQTIRPGDVNWMTAGRGIVHSERVPARYRQTRGQMHGLQAWIVLPIEDEECAPSFHHTPRSEIPRFEVSGCPVELIAGEAFGRKSPVKTSSRLFYFSVQMQAGQKFQLGSELMDQERALYLMRGSIRIEERSFQAPQMIVFRSGERVEWESTTDVHCVCLGGESLPGERFIYWNFVSSSRERIEKAKADWKEQRFPQVPGETSFVPLPEKK